MRVRTALARPSALLLSSASAMSARNAPSAPSSQMNSHCRLRFVRSALARRGVDLGRRVDGGRVAGAELAVVVLPRREDAAVVAH